MIDGLAPRRTAPIDAVANDTAAAATIAAAWPGRNAFVASPSDATADGTPISAAASSPLVNGSRTIKLYRIRLPACWLDDGHAGRSVPSGAGGLILQQCRGDIQIGTRPYPISYRSITPKAEECMN